MGIKRGRRGRVTEGSREGWFGIERRKGEGTLHPTLLRLYLKSKVGAYEVRVWVRFSVRITVGLVLPTGCHISSRRVVSGIRCREPHVWAQPIVNAER